MTLHNRPNADTQPDEVDLSERVDALHVDIPDDEEDELEDARGQDRVDRQPENYQQANTDQPLFPLNDIPDFTPSINEINSSLTSIQQEIDQLAARSTRFGALEQDLTGQHPQEEEEDLGDLLDLDQNLNKIDEALTKLDQENDQLQDKLRELLQTIRSNNNN